MTEVELTRVLATAIPSQGAEYCIVGIQAWWACMTNGEWASWVQAIGSIAVIFIAIGVSYLPGYNDARRSTNLARTLRDKAVNAIRGAMTIGSVDARGYIYQSLKSS